MKLIFTSIPEFVATMMMSNSARTVVEKAIQRAESERIGVVNPG